MGGGAAWFFHRSSNLNNGGFTEKPKDKKRKKQEIMLLSNFGGVKSLGKESKTLFWEQNPEGTVTESESYPREEGVSGGINVKNSQILGT